MRPPAGTDRTAGGEAHLPAAPGNPRAASTSRHRLAPVAAAFTLIGAWYGSFAIAAADIERELDVRHSTFGLLVALLFATMAIAHIPGGVLVERWGARTALVALVAATGVAELVGAVAPKGAASAASVLAIGAGAGALNAAMNALVLARLDGRPGAFVRFHAWWNVGVLLGAGLAGAVLSADLSHRFAWAGIGFATVALSPLVGRVAVPAAVRATRAPFRLRAVLASPRMAALATLFFAATAVEASLDVWGVLSLRERLGATPALGASAYAIGQVLAVVSRAVLGPLLARAGARRAAAVGAGSAAAGSVLQATAPSPVVAGAGLAVAVMGIALCGPLLLAHAGARSARPAPTVAALTAAALAGGVVGPPLVGVVADVLGVRAGLLTVAVVAAAMAGVLRLTGPPGWVRVGPR